jgi:ESCRT-II complex subunit VPS36
MRSQSSSNPVPDPPEPERDSFQPTVNPSGSDGSTKRAGIVCPRCTFENHPSLNSCEICGSPLGQGTRKALELRIDVSSREQSPDPVLGGLSVNESSGEVIKFSFRVGGDKTFYERLRNALVQRKWLLNSAPPVPMSNIGESGSGSSGEPQERQKVGIAGLERRGLEMRMNNEMVLGNAFEDLEALMTSAKEVAALAEKLAAQTNLSSGNDSTEASALLSQSASALGLVTTKDMLSSGTSSESLYASELARNLAEFLTDDTKGILKREGGIMSLVDLWAVFNRSRGGVELISPTDFEKAAQMWDKLKLPVRLRRFKSGLLVVQGRDRTDEKTVASLLAWLREFHIEEPEEDCPWDWRLYGRGVTAQETAERFGWSVGVASEELEMAEERGALCREQGLDGVKFWENWLANLSDIGYDLVAQ